MTEAFLYIPDRHLKPFVNIQKSFSMVSERTNKNSIISVATTSVAAADSDTGQEE